MINTTGPADLWPWGRMAGCLFLVLLACGPFSQVYVAQAVFAPGDPVATARLLSTNRGLFAVSICLDFVLLLAEIGLALATWKLFAPVHRELALAAAMLRFANGSAQGVTVALKCAALGALSYGDGTFAFALVDASRSSVRVWEIFFGAHCLVVALLCLMATNMPRLLGWLIGIAGLGYLTNAIGHVLMPEASLILAAMVGAGALIGEFPLFLWLLTRRSSQRRTV